MISSRFCLVNNKKVHYLVAGKGAPIVLLHPSPSSSKTMVPIIKELAPHFTVIAPDTPGYGQSDLLSNRPESLKDYCEYFNLFFQEIGLSKFAIYGSATGAQLAIRYGIEFPEQIKQLYLDNAAHFTESQRAKILESYFPDLQAKDDGSHLMTMWTMVHDLFIFFPWCFSSLEYRLKVPFPPAIVLHQIALDYLEAGANYSMAYRLAFHHERAEYVQALQVPTSLFHWQGSIVKPYIEQLTAHDFPQNVNEVIIPADRMLRYQKMKENILNTYKNDEALRYQFADFGIPQKETSLNPEDQEFLSSLPKLVPDENGAYLMTAWQYLRKRQLFLNPNEKIPANISTEPPNLDAQFLQGQLIKWMKTL